MNPDSPASHTGGNDPHESQLYSWRNDQPADQQAQQDAAAHVARHQAEHEYQHNPPNQLAAQQPQTDDNPYVRTHHQTYDWQHYHTAWQQYYQQYYARYYHAQLLAEQSKQTLLNGAPAQETITGTDDAFALRNRFQVARDDLLTKVAERTAMFHRSRRFVPIMSALVVALLLLFIQFNRVLVAQVEMFISPGSTVDANASIIVNPASSADVGAAPKLIIPKINVNAPVNYAVTTVDNNVIQNALEHGVVHYNLPGASSVPGQQGNTVILGHSSNDVFDPGSYKFVFVLLNRLQPGDIFYMNYQHRRYTYIVTGKQIIKPSAWHILQKNDGTPNVILVTSTPASTATNRLLVYGRQVSPDPSTASKAPANTQDANPADIPGNSPTFFERLGTLLRL